MKPFKFYIVLFCLLSLLIAACKNNKPTVHEVGEVYTCSMHPQIIRDNPGKCPICGMDLIKKETSKEATIDTSLNALIKPTDEFVLSSIPTVVMERSSKETQLNALGTIEYDNRQAGAISSRIAGRIEKLYVRYRYQYIYKGQKILDIYSPELLTSQENLIFLLKSDPNNQALISAAKQRLLLLGMSGQQIAQISRTRKPLYSVSVFSSYSGYVTEAGFNTNMTTNSGNNMKADATNQLQTASVTTTELPVKEGMYLNKGQTIFTVINADKAIVYLNIFSGEQRGIRKGTQVMIVPETAPDKKFNGTVDWIEPFYKPGSKTLSARVYFNNAALKLPIGSPVKATVFSGSQIADWLPASAVVTTGLENVVFKKEGAGFSARKVAIGTKTEDKVQIASGLSASDSVALNAQHLIGSESTIKTKE